MLLLVIKTTSSDAGEDQKNGKDGFADNLWQIVGLGSRNPGCRSSIVDVNQHRVDLNDIERMTCCETSASVHPSSFECRIECFDSSCMVF